MRILLVSEDIPYPAMGGLAKHVLTLARALIRAGHEVDILGGDQHPIEVAGEEGKFGGRFFGNLNGQFIQWKETKLGMFVPPRRTFTARRFARIIIKHAKGYDVVHYHGHVPNVALFIPAHINFVQTRHDQGSECLIDTRFRDGMICSATKPSNCASCKTKNPNVVQRVVSTMAVKRYRNETARAFLKHKTIFVSDMLKRNFSRTMGPKQWGTVVHNFTDRLSIERARAAVLSNRSVVGVVQVSIAAKLYPAKGVGTFLRELHGQIPANMHINIIGDGPDGPALREEFSNGKISFSGWCTPEKTLELAASSDIVVVPSVWEEPCATTVLEGLLLGKPTFALARGGTPELEKYMVFPGQLRLHSDMKSLVQDLISYRPETNAAINTNEKAYVEHAIPKLIEIYKRPAGNNLNIGH